MPTKLRRLSITLPREVDEAVSALAEIEQVPHSKVIVQYLTEMVPTMIGVAKITRQLKAGNKTQAKRTMQHVFGDQMAEMMQMGLDMKGSKK